MKRKINIYGIEIKYDENNIKIIDSYKVKSYSFKFLILQKFIYLTNYNGKRTIDSWIREWKTHNFLYKIGLFKEHTRDCDLEENESKFRLFVYYILGRFLND